MTEERQEKNRRLGEWLELHYYGRDAAGDWWTKPEDRFNAEAAFLFDPYTSESAAALLLDKMLSLGFMVEMWPQDDKRIIAIFNQRPYREYGRGNVADRKAAVADGALAYIESLAAQEKK